jgi:hypothetical protein
VDYNFDPGVIIGAMRDGAAVNEVALRQLKFFYADFLMLYAFLAL